MQTQLYSRQLNPRNAIAPGQPARRTGHSKICLRLTPSKQPQGFFCKVAARLIADRYGVSLRELSSPTRGSRHICRARQAAMYLAHVAFSIPLADVGEFFGRDRSTVSYACNRIEDGRDDPGFDADLNEMEIAATVVRALHPRAGAS